jgi:hypothetical protein
MLTNSPLKLEDSTPVSNGWQEVTVPEPAVWVFFYGSYINMDVVREAQYSPAKSLRP